MYNVPFLRRSAFFLLPLLGVLAFGVTSAHAQKPIPLTSTHVAGQTSTVTTLSFQLSATTSTTKAVTNGKFTSYSLPHGSSNLVKGPDGAFWYTASSANVIGRLNTNGTIKEYALPTAGYYPDNITSGPDGALWFSYSYDYTGAPSQYTYEIARLTTTGALTIFQISTDRSGFIDSLTSGSDGALWFEYSSSTSGGVDRITSSAQLTTYLLTIPRTNMAVGSDGAFWFGSKHQLARFTTSGTLSLTPLSDTTIWPERLASAPNLTFLFTDSVANKVGFISKTGVVTAKPSSLSNDTLADIIALDNGGYAYISYVTTDRYGDEIDYLNTVKSNGQVTTIRIPGNGYHGSNDILNGGNGVIWLIYGPTISSYRA